MPWQVMPSYDSYEEARAEFAWDLPESYNPATDFLRKHDDPDRIALHYAPPDGHRKTYSFRDLDRRSDRLARGLERLGVEPGDRIGVVVPQRPENPLTHLAAWKMGAVTVPLTVLFGTDALQYRLEDSGARVAVIDPDVRDELAAVRGDCPALEHVVDVGDDPPADNRAFSDVLADDSDGARRMDAVERADGVENADSAGDGSAYQPYDSTPGTHTAIMYTSGSTGPPKGVLHSHALWLGRAAAAHNYFDQGLGPEAVVWTPADWAWGAALGGTLFAAWHHGASVVGVPARGFDPERAFGLLEEFGVTHAFVPPTALRMLMTVEEPTERYDLALSTVAAAGEPLTPEIIEWVRETFDGVTINEFYGQTELNLVVGNCSRWFETRPSSMGKPLPGYDVAILDPETGEEHPENATSTELPPGEVGEIAVRPHDERVFFDEYWNLPEKTEAKRRGDWYLTGDLASRDSDGYLWFKSRSDDVIITAGYRVGPMEVERTVLSHPDVEQVGVVGVPDETRGEVIKAFVELVSGRTGGDALRAEIRELVRDRLAEYEYPREIAFVDELPQTTTGKIRRRDLREHGTAVGESEGE